MIASSSRLVMLVHLIDHVPLPPPEKGGGRGRPRQYSERLFLKALLIMLVRQISTVHGFLQVLAEETAEMDELRQALTEQGGYAPLVAIQGNEALAVARDRWPALVFTDLMMPRMNGTKLIAALRAVAASDGHVMPPIILMTAAGPKTVEAADADVTMQKPFEVVEIEELLLRFLGPPPAQ